MRLRFVDANARMANVDALEKIVADWTGEHTIDEVLSIAASAEVPCAKVAGSQTSFRKSNSSTASRS